MLKTVCAQLAPTGVLRAGINMSNPLLVSGKHDGGPYGVSPDLAEKLAEKLGIGVELIPFEGPGVLADALNDNVWDICNIANEAKRASTISFSVAYCEIEATYMVPSGSSITRLDQVDQPGNRIVSKHRAAYDLWLHANIKHATIINTASMDESFKQFAEGGFEVLACLRPKLMEQQINMPNTRILTGNFSKVSQAIGMRYGCPEAAAFLNDFIKESTSSGYIAELFDKYGVTGKLTLPSP